MIWSEPFCDLRDALQGNPGVRVPAATLQHALVELWRELNNMQELVTVTAQWVQQLHLPWQPEDREYMHVLAALRNVAAQMPQWHCKGYSPLELAMLEEEEIC